MNDITQYFVFEMAKVQLWHYYTYLALSVIIAFYLTFTSGSKYKGELFFLSFFLISGSISNLLVIVVPGLTAFEIQPERFIYLMLLFFIIRKTLFSKHRRYHNNNKMPWFEVALYGYVILLSISIFVNVFPAELKTMLDAIAFLIIVVALRIMEDKPSYDLIGRVIIVGAIFSSIVSLIQFSVDPYFLRIGDDRLAFGSIIRSNGIFSTEYFNSYFLIIAIAWTLTTVKSNVLKVSLVVLFSLGVLSSFQRMSWIIWALVLATYLIHIQKVAIEKLMLIGLAGLALVLSLSIFYNRDIMNSTLVKERLSESIDSRGGYYTMVLDNIGKKPLFGYGNLKNEVYYQNLLRITENRQRATAESGDLHSGYFSALFLYGIPAFICFTLFVVLSVIYYARSFKDNLYFVIPFLVSIIYMIGNLTNTFLFLKFIALLYAIHIGIGMGIHRIQEGSELLQTK